MHDCEQESTQLSTFSSPTNRNEPPKYNVNNLKKIELLGSERERERERERENNTWEFFGAEIGAQGRSTTKLAEVIVVSMGKVYREAGFDAIYQALEGARDS